MNTFLMISRFMNKTFALWVVVFGALGFVFPQVFKPVGAYVSILLGVVMFGMGLTLTTADFREIFRRPKDVAVGILAQFLIMPLAAFVLCKAFDLPPDLAVSLMLLGCVPGGTASNVVTFLARGDVALSVTVTSCTTLLAPVVTPALMYAFASQWLSIDPTAMFMSIVQVILVPIAAGVIVHKIFGAKVERVAAPDCVCRRGCGDCGSGGGRYSQPDLVRRHDRFHRGGAAECLRDGPGFCRRQGLRNGSLQVQVPVL